MKNIFKQISLNMIQTLTPKKSSETYDRNLWWMVYEKSAKGLHPLMISTPSKKAQDKEDEIKNIYMKLISGGMIINSNYIVISLNG